MSAPTVSIVIVNWKTPDLLAGCLDSIRLDARWQSFEILVVDNNSGDNSVDMVRRNYPEVQLIANAENVGFARACNQVIPHAKAPFVLLLNPDTVIVENAVSVMVDFMVNNPKCGAVGPKVLNPDGTLQLACRRSFPSPMASFFRLTYLSRIFPKNKLFAQYNLTFADEDQQLEVDALSGSCMMVRKSAIDRIGLLDEDIFMFGEDIDWCWRLKESGWTVVYAPQAKVFHFHGASSRLRPIGATINLHRGMEVFYRKHMAANYWAPFNWLVYLSIWSRAAIFIVLSWLKTLLPSRKDVQFAARVSSIPQARVEAGVGRGGKD